MGGRKLKELKSLEFVNHKDLVKFVNENKILQKDIQQIIYGNGRYLLLYWGLTI
jgi:hypothetical protein